MNKSCTILSCLVIMLVSSCKDLYKPDVISSANSYLVVEGVLNAGTGPTSIRLTKTFKLDDTARLQAERNAQVVVEGRDNSTKGLFMTADGIYTSPGLNLTINQEYRLRIKTANGREYLSDYIVARNTPPIDSIGWVEDEKGVNIHISTHDASNNTRYYRWEYDETWEINSFYFSAFKYENGVVIERPFTDNVYYCWKYDISHSILINSSARFETDNIYRSPLLSILRGNEKLAVRYSILARQYALDKEGYEFYEMMKKNSESLGSIFDPQPSEQRGNVKCISNPGELVIGYLSASTIEEKRIFIRRSQLNSWGFYQDCPELLVANHPDSIAEAYQSGGSIYEAVYSPMGGGIIQYKYSYKPCVECQDRGGSNIRPSYW